MATRGESTKSVKLQIAATKAPKLVKLGDFLHVDFRGSFCTVFQADAGFLPSLSELGKGVQQVDDWHSRQKSSM
jgi:hypothetical protein